MNKIKSLKIFQAKQEIKFQELYDEMISVGHNPSEITNMLVNIIITNYSKNVSSTGPIMKSEGEKTLEVLKILKSKIREYRGLISNQLESLDRWSLDEGHNFRKMKENADVITHKISELEDNIIYLKDLEDK